MKFGVSLLASHSALTSALTRELMDRQLMESWPVAMLLGEKAAGDKQRHQVLIRDPLSRLDDTIKDDCVDYLFN